ncbi:MAG: TIGR03905 family TSCPD domain-containing protein [Lachnospiraceae bacterium]|nr:TIGR03905 family TSCPD domain-containing protein [Lachnospiraceae bacterium]
MKYVPKGVCSTLITIEVEGTTIKSVKFTGGCNGNQQGISNLVAGMEIDDVIEKMEGIKCGFRSTSCPDQLAKALKELKAGTSL